MIESKIVYIKKKESFESLISTIPEKLNPLIFIEETKEIWINGTYFNVGYPKIGVEEISGVVYVNIGDSGFSISTTGDAISIRKGINNNIILNSNALTYVPAESPLKWVDSSKKLIHEDSGVKSGNYGASSNISNASIITVPNITVNSTGHIIEANNINIGIRDYVVQLSSSSLLNGYRSILLSYSDSELEETSSVRKAYGLKYDNSIQKLLVEGGIETNNSITINEGDLKVSSGYIVGKLKGDVEGEAIPKIHLSSLPEYGGASTKLYGHVLIQDTVPLEDPGMSSNNEDKNNTNVTAVAASPKMVWDSAQNIKDYINTHGIKITGIGKNEELIDLSSGFSFSSDFDVSENNVQINWIEI